MGRTNELNVACEVACEDETARMSEGDVGPVLVVNTTEEDGSKGGSAMRETMVSIGTNDWLFQVRRGIQ